MKKFNKQTYKAFNIKSYKMVGQFGVDLSCDFGIYCQNAPDWPASGRCNSDRCGTTAGQHCKCWGEHTATASGQGTDKRRQEVLAATVFPHPRIW